MNKKLLLFTAPWCQPCKAFKPIFNDTQEKYPQIKFDVVDIGKETNMKYARSLKVMSVPTLVYLENDIKIADKIGPTNENHIIEIIEDNAL